MIERILKVICFFLIQGCFAAPVFAVDTIQVMALFKDKAVIKVDDERHTLSIGDTSPEGVKLVAADSETAVLEVDGHKKSYPLGSAMSIGTKFRVPEERMARAYADSRGMYHIQGSINGYTMRFLVDTGATSIAMNEVQGKRLGIDYRLEGKQVFVSTASGMSKAYAVNLDVVKIGEIKINNVQAVIIEGGFPKEVLLGMSFLGRVQIEREGSLMHMKKKY